MKVKHWNRGKKQRNKETEKTTLVFTVWYNELINDEPVVRHGWRCCCCWVEVVCGVELGFVWWELEQSRARLEVISSTGSWQKEKWARKSNSVWLYQVPLCAHSLLSISMFQETKTKRKNKMTHQIWKASRKGKVDFSNQKGKKIWIHSDLEE